MSNLQKLRKEAGMSQSQLAEASGVSVRMIQYYEQGAKDINRAEARTIRALAHTLGCAMEEILEGRE